MTKKLAIIGAGPGGLATARVFLENTSDYDITIFEKNAGVGGLWYYPENDRNGRVMYDNLETNLDKRLMQFSGFPFEEKVRKFPLRQDVWKYLEDYYQTFIAKNGRVHLHFNTEVKSLEKANDWIVKTIEVNDNNNKDKVEKVYDFDYVVVANGHFTVPFFPKPVPGFKEWLENKAVLHASEFQNGLFAKGKNVVVVGNGSSGTDIANQLSTLSDKVYNSINKEVVSEEDHSPDDLFKTIPRIQSVDWSKHSVTLVDGEVIEGIDYLLYATGYYYDFPFVLEPEKRAALLGNETEQHSLHVGSLWKQLIYAKDSSLAFSLIPLGIVPFPLAELQASVIAKVFNGKIKVNPDSKNETNKKYDTGEDIAYYRDLQSILDKNGGAEDLSLIHI